MASSRVRLTWDDRQLVRTTQQALTAGLREAAKFARRGIKAELGKPGPSPAGSPPGKVSGDLRKAVGYRVKTRAGKFSAVDVGVLRPSPHDDKFPGERYAQALRLARGYVGRDRLGRTYNQRARPFVDPFVARNRGEMARLVETTARQHTPKARRRT